MRGQFFSFDFIFAVSLIVFLFGLALFISQSVSGTINSSEQGREIQISADNALSQLVETGGNPSNWEYLQFDDANVKSIGLSSERNVLARAKVDQFFTAVNSNADNYRLAKRILGLDLPSTDFAISISNDNSTLYQTNLQPPKNASVYSRQRIAILEGGQVYVNLKIWVNG